MASAGLVDASFLFASPLPHSLFLVSVFLLRHASYVAMAVRMHSKDRNESVP